MAWIVSNKSSKNHLNHLALNWSRTLITITIPVKYPKGNSNRYRYIKKNNKREEPTMKTVPESNSRQEVDFVIRSEEQFHTYLRQKLNQCLRFCPVSSGTLLKSTPKFYSICVNVVTLLTHSNISSSVAPRCTGQIVGLHHPRSNISCAPGLSSLEGCSTLIFCTSK